MELVQDPLISLHFSHLGCIFEKQSWLSQNGRNLFNEAKIRNLWGLVFGQTSPSTILDDFTHTFPFGAPECGGPSPKYEFCTSFDIPLEGLGPPHSGAPNGKVGVESSKMVLGPVCRHTKPHRFRI